MTGIGKSTLLAIALSSLILVAGCAARIAPDASASAEDECDRWTACGVVDFSVSCAPPDIAGAGLADRHGCRVYFCCPPDAITFPRAQ